MLALPCVLPATGAFALGAGVAVQSSRSATTGHHAIADDGGSRACSRHALIACGTEHPRRTELERYVQQAFALKHAAQVRSFMPTLLALQGLGGRVCGVTGYREAAVEDLFLERYLDQPVQDAIAAASGAFVNRTQIVEVGNLASLSCRAAVHLVALLPQHLLQQSQRWVVFTATQGVRHILQRFRAPLYELAPARAECVSGLGDDWGSYYRTDPRVMAGYLPDGLKLAGFPVTSQS